MAAAQLRQQQQQARGMDEMKWRPSVTDLVTVRQQVHGTAPSTVTACPPDRRVVPAPPTTRQLYYNCSPFILPFSQLSLLTWCWFKTLDIVVNVYINKLQFHTFYQNNALIKSDEFLRHSVVGCSLHVHIYLNWLRSLIILQTFGFRKVWNEIT